MKILNLFLCSSLLCLLPLSAAFSDGENQNLATQIEALTKTVNDLQRLVKTQQAEIDTLKNTKAKSKPSVVSAASSSVKRTASNNLSAFNPEIGVVADVLGKLTESDEDEEGNDKLSARHVELIFGHDIDPYSRLDVNFTLSDLEDAHLEEAYITHWGLPLGIKGRLGRFFPKVGKYSALHIDQLDTSDQALVVEDLFGHEGFTRTGLDLSYFVPTPWDNLTHEVTVGLSEGGVGHGGKVFGDTERRPTFYTHLRNFWEISDASSYELSGTYLMGSSDEDSSYEVDVYGVHSTFNHYFNSVNRLKFQVEAYFQKRDEEFTASAHHDHSHSLQGHFRDEHDDHDDEDHEGHDDHGVAEEHEEHDDDHDHDLHHFKDNPFGMYSLVDYRLSPSWGLGFRYDYVEPLGLEEDAFRNYDSAYSAYVTFYQSEFARWRAQYQHIDFAEAGGDDRFFFQGTFAIGVHKHQLQ